MKNTPIQKQLLILQIKCQDEQKLNRRWSGYNEYQTIQLAASIIGENIERINEKNALYQNYNQKLLKNKPTMETITQIKIITNTDSKYIHEAIRILNETINIENDHADAYTKNSCGILSYEAE